jgi:predicted dehydrogenase
VIIDSGELGALKSITGDLVLPQGNSETDIQFNYNLGGGALMGLGCEYIF